MAAHVKSPGSNLGKTFRFFFFNFKLKISVESTKNMIFIYRQEYDSHMCDKSVKPAFLDRDNGKRTRQPPSQF